MTKNPVIPYILIMAFGIGLIFFMSMYGVDKQAEIAGEGENQSETQAGVNVAFDPEAFAQDSCITCHGNALEGAGAPALKGTDLSKEELVDIIKNGQGAMPPFPNIDHEAMADYILSLE